MRSKSSEVAPLEDLRQQFLHSANKARACQMLQEAEALVKDVTALGRWPSDIKSNPTERILIWRIRKLRDDHASGALQPAVDGAAQPTVIAQLEDLQRKLPHAGRKRWSLPSCSLHGVSLSNNEAAINYV